MCPRDDTTNNECSQSAPKLGCHYKFESNFDGICQCQATESQPLPSRDSSAVFAAFKTDRVTAFSSTDGTQLWQSAASLGGATSSTVSTMVLSTDGSTIFGGTLPEVEGVLPLKEMSLRVCVLVFARLCSAMGTAVLLAGTVLISTLVQALVLLVCIISSILVCSGLSMKHATVT